MNSPTGPTIDLDTANNALNTAEPAQIVQWAIESFGEGLVVTTSFGVQSAVMLHLVTSVVPKISVIFIDTGFHFPETYQFADRLTARLNLNLKVYQSELSPARMVAMHGRLWEQGVKGLDSYNRIRKVEPMQHALRNLAATAWLAGLRQEQTKHRATLKHVEIQDSRYKIHPILRWTHQQVDAYLDQHNLPYHPLRQEGFASVGDWHSTKKVTGEMGDRDGRFSGLKQECGLHLPHTEEEDASRLSSGL